MRFLFVDANYPSFLAEVYREDPDLRNAPYGQQIASIRQGLFGEAQFQADALRELGHEAEVIITNAHAAQLTWAHEHGIKPSSTAGRWTVGRRRGLPWPARATAQTDWTVVLAQARDYRPDVIYMEIMDSIPAEVAREIVSLARYSVAQIAAPIPRDAFRDYGLLISSIPGFVDDFQSAGANAALIPLAFEPRIHQLVPAAGRDVGVSFVGSVGPSHPTRTTVIEHVADSAVLDLWTQDARALNTTAPVKVHGPAFGRAMYEVLGRSRITLNAHAPWAGGNSNNLRLYEATGMGALIVTDAGRNLGDLFSVGSEVIAYRTPAEAAELVTHFVNRPDEAARIAAAGQARTLREHTWTNRMSAVISAVGRMPGERLG